MLAFLRTMLLPSAVLVAAAVLALAGDAPPGVSWLAGTPVAGHATELRLASGPRGHAVMAWTANGPRGTAIIAALRAPARPFGAPVVLGTGRVSRPRVAIGWNGDAVAVWRRRTRGATVLEAALRDAGGGFARAVRLDGGTV